MSTTHVAVYLTCLVFMGIGIAHVVPGNWGIILFIFLFFALVTLDRWNNEELREKIDQEYQRLYGDAPEAS